MKRVLFLSYFLVIILRTRIVNLVVVLVALEVLSWGFVILFGSSSILKYLLIQRVFVPLSLFSLVVFNKALVVFLMLKIGLPPFHSWLVKVLSEVNFLVFIFMRTFHKLVPLFFFVKLITFVFSLVFCSYLILMRIFLFVSFSYFLGIMISSSFFNTRWMLLSRKLFFSLGLFY